MFKPRRNSFRFRVLRVINDTGPIDEFALAEEVCLRTQKQEPIRVRFTLRVLNDLEAKGWVYRTTSIIPNTPTWVSIFTITRAGERALRTSSENPLEWLVRVLRHLKLRS